MTIARSKSGPTIRVQLGRIAPWLTENPVGVEARVPVFEAKRRISFRLRLNDFRQIG